MTLREFSNALRIMTSIDAHELVNAGVIKQLGPDKRAMDWETWNAFRADPYRWFVRASDGDQAKVWAIIERRQPR